MGLFSKKSQSLEVGDLSDDEIRKVLKSKKAPVLSAKELKKMEKDDIRRTVGEKGLQALVAAAKQHTADRDNRFNQLTRDMKAGRDPHALARMKAEDPKRYQRLLEAEAKRQGLR